MAAGEPAHRNFALRFQQRVATSLVIPMAVFQGITGVLLVWRISFDLFTRGWLIVSVVLYLIALGIAFGVMLPALRTLVPATAGGPPPAPAGGGPPPGPPPHIVATIRRARLGGMLSATLVLIIVFLMVTKPF
jgi:uncharacterized membrane protein